jgi:hypothetical protein
MRTLIPWPLIVLAIGAGATLAGEFEYRRVRDTMFDDVVRNQIQVQHLRSLRADCERIARKARYFPRSAAELNRQLDRKIPKGPWGGDERVILEADAEVVAASERSGVDYKIIGNGRFDRRASSPRSYGAILYRGDGRSFSLYAVGKVRDWAVVVATERGALD